MLKCWYAQAGITKLKWKSEKIFTEHRVHHIASLNILSGLKLSVTQAFINPLVIIKLDFAYKP